MQIKEQSLYIYKILMDFKRGWFLGRDVCACAYTFDIQFISFTQY